MATPKKSAAHAEDATASSQMRERDQYLFEMARRRRAALGSYKGRMSLSLEEALAPLDEEELAAWGLGRES